MKENQILSDVQGLAPDTPLNIDCVGIAGLRCPLRLRDRKNGNQVTIAQVDLGVNLPATYKGTHMSRLVEALEDWDEQLSYQTMCKLLTSMLKRLEAAKAWARFTFPYLVRKDSPTGGGAAVMAYDCAITGELSNKEQSFLLNIAVPVMTVCPCSKAISNEGAHSQRALIKMKIRIINFVWLEEFIDIAESSASSAVYPLLKRKDEKFVTEQAFARPVFVEDVVRKVAAQLNGHPDVLWFEVEVESMESIHNHNAFARIRAAAQ